MINDDTIKLLKECNAGIKTGINSINEVLEQTQDEHLKNLLKESKEKHATLGDTTHTLLNDYHDAEKDPKPIARAMSWLKINTKLVLHPSDNEVAELIFDGCNMGVKSLYRYLNQYQAADEVSKQLAQAIIKEEETLRQKLINYL